MELYGITAVSRRTGIHESSLRRWEDMGLIEPRRIDLGKTTVRVYDEVDVALLVYAKELMDSGMKLRVAFKNARIEFDGEESEE